MVHEGDTHLTGTEARAGSKTKVTRYVLGISLTLIVIIFAVLLFLYR
ncbi:hypothetical protein PQ455_17480 [Sphingomonas naphthae]|uniref:Aa3-type cytochrome c oxidase subunit IV n=1 Tax=Sphingomonas naphthae TaxID=1813468 RepID=A0ABY7TKY9_9SPHN|nr:hypothetical protein [Sphingomonas naphthae]WCT73377.1 hypothetical protein PQ455_17480 [Sphingomonas naphthae]